MWTLKQARSEVGRMATNHKPAIRVLLEHAAESSRDLADNIKHPGSLSGLRVFVDARCSLIAELIASAEALETIEK